MSTGKREVASNHEVHVRLMTLKTYPGWGFMKSTVQERRYKSFWGINGRGPIPGLKRPQPKAPKGKIKQAKIFHD